MGSAAPALVEMAPESYPEAKNIGATEATVRPRTDLQRSTAEPKPTEIKLKPRSEAPSQQRPEANADTLRDAVLNVLSNQQMLVSLLESAEWTLNGNLLIAKVAASATMIEMSFNADARRIASAAASGQAGRPIKMQVESGASTQAAPAVPRRASNGSARGRAEEDPIVQRMKEKFGAEIRTVIDYREKG